MSCLLDDNNGGWWLRTKAAEISRKNPNLLRKWIFRKWCLTKDTSLIC